MNFSFFNFQVRWGDAHDEYGEHYWEYNDGTGKNEEPAYVPAQPSYSN